MNLFQKVKAGKGSTTVQAGGDVIGNAIGSNTRVYGNGNRTAGAGSYNNVFGDGSSVQITQANGVSVKQHNGRVDIDLPKGYALYINGERTEY